MNTTTSSNYPTSPKRIKQRKSPRKIQRTTDAAIFPRSQLWQDEDRIDSPIVKLCAENQNFLPIAKNVKLLQKENAQSAFSIYYNRQKKQKSLAPAQNPREVRAVEEAVCDDQHNNMLLFEKVLPVDDGTKDLDYSSEELEVHNVNRTRNENDENPIDAIISTCNKLNLVTESMRMSTRSARNESSQKINLQHYGLGHSYANALAKGIGTNANPSFLNLSQNRLGWKGISSVAEAMITGARIVSLNVSHNQLGLRGAAVLGKALRVSETLAELNVANNSLGDLGIDEICKGLIESKVRLLHYLNVNSNSIGSNGANSLARAVTANGQLKTLDASWNSIRGKGAVAIMASASNLFSINLSWNALGGTEIARGIAHALECSLTLETVVLSQNNFDISDIALILEGMLKSLNLKCLHLDNNLKRNPSALPEDFYDIFQNRNSSGSSWIFTRILPSDDVVSHDWKDMRSCCYYCNNWKPFVFTYEPLVSGPSVGSEVKVCIWTSDSDEALHKVELTSDSLVYSTKLYVPQETTVLYYFFVDDLPLYAADQPSTSNKLLEKPSDFQSSLSKVNVIEPTNKKSEGREILNDFEGSKTVKLLSNEVLQSKEYESLLPEIKETYDTTLYGLYVYAISVHSESFTLDDLTWARVTIELFKSEEMGKGLFDRFSSVVSDTNKALNFFGFLQCLNQILIVKPEFSLFQQIPKDLPGEIQKTLLPATALFKAYRPCLKEIFKVYGSTSLTFTQYRQILEKVGMLDSIDITDVRLAFAASSIQAVKASPLLFEEFLQAIGRLAICFADTILYLPPSVKSPHRPKRNQPSSVTNTRRAGHLVLQTQSFLVATQVKEGPWKGFGDAIYKKNQSITKILVPILNAVAHLPNQKKSRSVIMQWKNELRKMKH